MAFKVLNMKFLALFLGFLLCAGPAHGFEPVSLFDIYKVGENASFLGTLWRGIEVGSVTGFSAGWVRYADTNMQDVWRNTGLGALAGAGFGLGAELLKQRTAGNRFLFIMDLGGRVGAGVGTLWGTIAGLSSGKTERIGEGAAWGQVTGTALGLLYAGYLVAAGKPEMEKPGIPNLPPTFGLAPGASGTFLLTFEKHF